MGLMDRVNALTQKAAQTAGSITNHVKSGFQQGMGTTPAAQETSAAGTTENRSVYYPQPLAFADTLTGPVDQRYAAMEPWHKAEGEARDFVLKGHTLAVSADMDLANTYRLRFRRFAAECVRGFKEDYLAQIKDLPSFAEQVPGIYDRHLYPLMQKVVDVLIEEGIWSETVESVAELYRQEFCFAGQCYEEVLQVSVDQMEQNRQVTSGVMQTISELAGMSSSSWGGLVGTLADGLQDVATQSTGLSYEQQVALFGKIELDEFAQFVFADYWNVYLTVLYFMRENGRTVWSPSQEDEQEKRLFQNLSNPNFPADQVIPAMFKLLEMDPYHQEYYHFLCERFGETAEVTALRDYFGYCPDDLPADILVDWL